jgi:hypothetical protein
MPRVSTWRGFALCMCGNGWPRLCLTCCTVTRPGGVGEHRDTSLVQKQKLACDLVKDQFGDLVYKVLHHLVHRGRATLQELGRATQQPPAALKSCLLSLLQHNCIDAYKVRQPLKPSLASWFSKGSGTPLRCAASCLCELHRRLLRAEAADACGRSTGAAAPLRRAALEKTQP